MAGVVGGTTHTNLITRKNSNVILLHLSAELATDKSITIIYSDRVLSTTKGLFENPVNFN
jgi:hypothetical protein